MSKNTRTRANSTKHTTVNTTDATMAPQNPNLPSSQGKAINMGKVGITYQNV